MLKIVERFFNALGFVRAQPQVTLTVNKFDYVNLIRARGKFTSDQPGIDEFDQLLNRLSLEFGYPDWLDAYNKINHPSYVLDNSMIIDMKNIPVNYKMDMIQAKIVTPADVCEKLAQEKV